MPRTGNNAFREHHGCPEKTYSIDRHHLYISSSIGVSLIDATSQNANRFIKEADIAMYEVKEKGRDGVFLFDTEMSRRVERHLAIERMLHFAVKNNEIYLNFQPMIGRHDQISGAEALVRWNNLKLGNIPPDQFIPNAEQTGLIIELRNYIVETAFSAFKDWHQQGIEFKKKAINISMRQFLHQNFIPEVKRLAELYLDQNLHLKITFEITETIVAEDIHRAIEVMQELKTMDIRFAMVVITIRDTFFPNPCLLQTLFSTTRTTIPPRGCPSCITSGQGTLSDSLRGWPCTPRALPAGCG